MRFTWVMAVVIFVLGAASAQADSVIYNFVGVGTAFDGFPAEPVGFILTAPSFLDTSTPVSFTCDQLDSSTNCLAGAAGLIFSTQPDLGAFSAVLQFNASNGVGYPFEFPTGAFQFPGVYNTGTQGSGPATLTVTTTPVPEPSSIYLLGGFLSAIGVLRTRILKA